MPLPPFSRKATARRGVSELYASMLMVGVTLSLGGVVVAAALGTFGQAEGSASMGASLRESASGIQVSLAYATVASSMSCPVYQGVNEGTSLTVSLFDYGTVAFAPTDLIVNSTAYAGSYAPIPPGSMAMYVIGLGSCAHPSGLTIAATDAAGDEVQVAS